MENSFEPCKLCRHNSPEYFYYCQDCVGAQSLWKPSKVFTQFLVKHNYALSPIFSKTIVILAFPGCGKTYLKERLKGSGIRILDSDSSNFNKEYFPQNYIDYIESQIGEQDIILISTHEDVRKAIYDSQRIMSECAVYICYPSLKIKDLWIDRLRNRGNNEKFCKLIETNYDKWINDIENENYFFPLILNHGKDYLANHLYQLSLDTDTEAIIHDWLYNIKK